MGGDHDPAGIVYFPRYFAIFDGSTTALIERALGTSKYELVLASTPIPGAVVERLSAGAGDDPGHGLRSAAGHRRERGGHHGQ